MEIIKEAPWHIFAPWTANGDINGIAWAFYMAIGALVLTGILEFIGRVR